MAARSSLADALATATAGSGGTACKLGTVILPQLTVKERENLVEALARPNSAATVARVLTEGGFPITPNPVRNHQRRLCGCFRKA